MLDSLRRGLREAIFRSPALLSRLGVVDRRRGEEAFALAVPVEDDRPPARAWRSAASHGGGREAVTQSVGDAGTWRLMCATRDPSHVSTATKVVLATIGTAALLVVATLVNYALA